MRKLYTAPKYYECPACLHEYEQDRHEGGWGEFKVSGTATPGEKPVYYPNHHAHPGSPPEIDRVWVEAYTECRHSDDEEVLDDVAEDYREDFFNGDVPIEGP